MFSQSHRDRGAYPTFSLLAATGVIFGTSVGWVMSLPSPNTTDFFAGSGLVGFVVALGLFAVAHIRRWSNRHAAEAAGTFFAGFLAGASLILSLSLARL